MGGVHTVRCDVVRGGLYWLVVWTQVGRGASRLDGRVSGICDSIRGMIAVAVLIAAIGEWEWGGLGLGCGGMERFKLVISDRHYRWFGISYHTVRMVDRAGCTVHRFYG